jgi:hypothetical protein
MRNSDGRGGERKWRILKCSQVGLLEELRKNERAE